MVMFRDCIELPGGRERSINVLDTMDMETRLDMMCMTCLIEFPGKSVISSQMFLALKSHLCCLKPKPNHGQSWIMRHPAIYGKMPED